MSAAECSPATEGNEPPTLPLVWTPAPGGVIVCVESFPSVGFFAPDLATVVVFLHHLKMRYGLRFVPDFSVRAY